MKNFYYQPFRGKLLEDYKTLGQEWKRDVFKLDSTRRKTVKMAEMRLPEGFRVGTDVKKNLRTETMSLLRILAVIQNNELNFIHYMTVVLALYKEMALQGKVKYRGKCCIRAKVKPTRVKTLKDNDKQYDPSLICT
jgi:hypothetical protein